MCIERQTETERRTERERESEREREIENQRERERERERIREREREKEKERESQSLRIWRLCALNVVPPHAQSGTRPRNTIRSQMARSWSCFGRWGGLKTSRTKS